LPIYSTVTPSLASQWIWTYEPNRDAAPYLPTSNARIASCWYSYNPFNIDIGAADKTTHRVSAYFLDWDFAGRQQRVEIVDATSGAILDTRTISNFSSGVYLVWDVVGDVRLRVTPLNYNAVVSGLFFDAAN
jgi:hypothetical protein